MKNEKKIFLIAEIGINHNGDLKIAKKLIDLAKDSGFDAVKFQKRDIDTVYTKEFLDSPRESPWGKTQKDQKEGLEFTEKEYDQIKFVIATRDISTSILSRIKRFGGNLESYQKDNLTLVWLR